MNDSFDIHLHTMDELTYTLMQVDEKHLETVKYRGVKHMPLTRTRQTRIHIPKQLSSKSPCFNL